MASFHDLVSPYAIPGESILPRNFGRGPGLVRANLRVAKTFAFGPAGETAAPTTGGRRPPTGPFNTAGGSGGSSSGPKHDLDSFIKHHHEMPSAVWLGSTPVPPEAFLVAMAKTASKSLTGSSHPEKVSIAPARLPTEKYIAIDSMETWSWPIFPPGFHSEHLMELARLQAWPPQTRETERGTLDLQKESASVHPQQDEPVAQQNGEAFKERL